MYLAELEVVSEGEEVVVSRHGHSHSDSSAHGGAGGGSDGRPGL